MLHSIVLIECNPRSGIFESYDSSTFIVRVSVLPSFRNG